MPDKVKLSKYLLTFEIDICTEVVLEIGKYIWIVRVNQSTYTISGDISNKCV